MRKTLSLLALIVLVGCSNYSSGSRTGVVTKFSKKGLIYKTYEGELVMGGARKTTDGEGRSSVSANVWAFSVEEESVANDLQKALDAGATVKVDYTQSLGFTGNETTYKITKVTILK